MSGFDRRAAIAFALLAACAGEDLPEPPNVSSFLAAYIEPMGVVETSQPAPWLGAAEEQLDQLGVGEGDLVIIDVFETARAQLDAVSLPDSHDGPLPTRVDGAVELDVSCGPSEEQSAHVTVPIEDGTLSRLVWGTAHGCSFLDESGALVSYEGSFVMYRYLEGNLFVRLEGTTIASDKAPLVLDFIVFDGGGLETRVATATGDVIASRSGSDVLVRASNGVFRCDRGSRACRSVLTNE